MYPDKEVTNQELDKLIREASEKGVTKFDPLPIEESKHMLDARMLLRDLRKGKHGTKL